MWGGEKMGETLDYKVGAATLINVHGKEKGASEFENYLRLNFCKRE